MSTVTSNFCFPIASIIRVSSYLKNLINKERKKAAITSWVNDQPGWTMQNERTIQTHFGSNINR